jgi:hypothetical protein
VEESLEDGEKMVNVSWGIAHSVHKLKGNIYSLDVKFLAIELNCLSIFFQEPGAQLYDGMFLPVFDPLASIGVCFSVCVKALFV